MSSMFKVQYGMHESYDYEISIILYYGSTDNRQQLQYNNMVLRQFR